MLGDDNIYDTVSISHTTALVATLSLLTATGAFILFQYVRKRFALKKQDKLTRKTLDNRDQIVANAWQKLDQLAASVHAKTTRVNDGAYQASAITRQAFDQLMNHSTLFQSKSEVKQRSLRAMADAMNISYPLEFDRLESVHSMSDFDTLITKAKEILNECY